MEVKRAPDVKKIVSNILKHTPFLYIQGRSIVCMRSYGAKSRARARIWSFPKIWQQALDISPHYIIEVVSQHFDHLSNDDKIRVLIHELMHIPKNFSGALVPHRGIHKKINHSSVETVFQIYKKNDYTHSR